VRDSVIHKAGSIFFYSEEEETEGRKGMGRQSISMSTGLQLFTLGKMRGYIHIRPWSISGNAEYEVFLIEALN
jgi:hypothetical protein